MIWWMGMIQLSAATLLLQWAAGGLLFCWVTTRHREVGLGYGWLLRATFLLMAAGAFAAGVASGTHVVRDGASLLVVLATASASATSIVRRRAGVAGQRAHEERRSARVTAMTGIERQAVSYDPSAAEFAPVLDLVAPAVAVVGLVAAAAADGGPVALAIARTLIGAVFLGSVTDAMLLGHWYLVQPGLGRARLNELVRWVAIVWPFEVAVMLWPTGMVQVIDGTVKDGYGGVLGWFWLACAAATIILCGVTRAALKERAYSAVMAATGLLYLAILTAFGTDVVARAVLAR